MSNYEKSKEVILTKLVIIIVCMVVIIYTWSKNNMYMKKIYSADPKDQLKGSSKTTYSDILPDPQRSA